MTGNIDVVAGSEDRYLAFWSASNNVSNWRIGYQGSGHAESNYFVLQSSKDTIDTWTNALQFGNRTLDATFAGKIIAPQGLQGNADTASKFKTAQTITVAGDATGTVTFDGSEAKTLNLDVGSADQLSSNYKINGTAFNGSKDITTASWGAARDVNITDGTNTGTATSIGAATSGSYSLKLPTTIKAALDGNAKTATQLETTRTIGLGGHVTGSASFNGTKDIVIDVTVSDDSHLHTKLKATGFGGDSSAAGLVPDAGGYAKFFYGFSDNTLGSFPANNYANTILAISRHNNANYNSQLGFSSNGSIYYRAENGTAFTDDTEWKKLAFTSDNVASADKWSTARTITLTGGATGSVSIDGSANQNLEVTVTNDGHHHSNSTIDNLDASKITSGIISISRLPQGALERLVVVADDTARFKLTTSNVQLGDVVKVTATDVMYFVKDAANLGNENGYELFAAGRAASVNWANIENVPTLKLSGHATGEIDLSGVAASGKVLNVTIADDSHAHNSQYLRRDGANYMTGNIVFAAGNTDKAIEFTSNASGTVAQSHSWKIVYEGSKDANNNYLSFQSTKTGTTWDRALYFESETLNATFGGTVTASQGFIGNASTATTLQTARNIALGGDVTGTATSFNGSADITIDTVVTSAQTGFAINAEEGNPSILNLMRSGSGNWASWRFRNESGNLYFDCNYTDKIVDWYPAITINYNTGNTTFKGNVTAPKFIGALQGNADTASKWATARTFSLTGDVTGETTIDGSGNITFEATVGDDSHLHDGRYVKLAGSTMTGNLVLPVGADVYDNASLYFGTKTRIGTGTNNTFGIYSTGNINLRPNNGTLGCADGIEIGTTSVIPTKNNTVTLGDSTHTWKTVYGNATSASKWATARTITVAGDATGSVEIDGSANKTLTLDVATAAKTDYALTVNVTNVVDTTTTTTFNGSAAKTININASDFMPLTSFTKTLTLKTDWQDIGISSNNIANSGSYIIQILVNDGGTTGTLSNYSEYYTGVMSWYASDTNSTDTDEIILHKAGHASNSRYIYLRTVRTSAGTLKMQIAANVTATAASTLVIKVRQLI